MTSMDVFRFPNLHESPYHKTSSHQRSVVQVIQECSSIRVLVLKLHDMNCKFSPHNIFVLSAFYQFSKDYR